MRRLALAAIAALSVAHAHAQRPADPETLIAAQREAMAPLKAMDGAWRGSAWTLQPGGKKKELVQTERIGPFLEGSVKVIEGRGYEADGSVGFNALGVVYYDPERKAYGMRSWAHGRSGDFRFEPTADGYVWEVPFKGGLVRYAATIKDGRLKETGHRVVEGRPPVQFFEMDLERIGDTDWPLGTPIPMR